MRTLLLKVDPKRPEIKKIKLAAEVIKRGGLVAFPTETCYGLGANALRAEAVERIYWAKRRPLDNPIIVHIANKEDVYRLAIEVPERAEALMERFWPGPLTLVLKRSEIVPDVTVAGLETVAIRMPDNRVALTLIRKSQPIAAPTANLAGRPSPTTAEHVLEDLAGRVDVILDGGPTRIGVESTVLNLTIDPPEILRPGGLPKEALEEVLGEVRLHPIALAEEVDVERPLSPGMKYRHYAPRAKLIVVEGGDLEAMVEKARELAEEHSRRGLRVSILATDETDSIYDGGWILRSLGSREDLSTIARNLFKCLRELDEMGVDLIIAEGVPMRGLGLAVMNRLRKASGLNIIRDF